MSNFFSDDEEDSLPLRAASRPTNTHSRVSTNPRERERDSLPSHASSSRSRGDEILSSPGRSSFYDQFNDTDYERGSSAAPAGGEDSLSTVNTVGGGRSRRFALGTQDLEDDEDGDVGMDLDLGRDLEDLQPFVFEDDNDIKKLIRAWTRERGTRDLMNWEEDVVEDCLHKIGQQVSSWRVRHSS